mgnify:CR=1 FL=1
MGNNREQKAIQLLKKLEWSGYTTVHDEIWDTDICPVCNNSKSQGHTGECELGLLLKKSMK